MERAPAPNLASAKGKRKKVALRGKDGVYKRGSKWFAIVEYPKDPKTGQRRRRRSEGCKTRKDAEAERDRLRNEIRTGFDVPPEKITVGALLDRFVADKVASKLDFQPTSKERYLDHAARAKRHLGSMMVAKIRPAHVQALYTDLLSRCRICSRVEAEQPARKHKCVSGLSSTSVRHLHGFLRSAFSWAVDQQIVLRNPVAAIKKEDAPKRANPKTDAFNDVELAALLDAARSTRWDAALMLAVATGMRRGELAALRWEDVSIETDAAGIESATLTVSRAFAQTRTSVALKSTKTGATRLIPISRLGLAALERQRFRQGHDASKAQDGYVESGYVFTDPLGAPYPPRAFTDAFDKIRQAAGVHKRLHDARHTAASQLIAAKVDIYTVATILGHSSPQTTLTIYAHQIAGQKEDAMAKLDVRLRAAIERGQEGGK